MTKLKNPLMSLKATGGLAKLFSLAKRQGRHIIERKPILTDAKSPAQLFNRNMFSMCKDLWHTLSDAEHQEWESLARPKHMSGYAWYLSQCLRPNPGIYLPLIGGKMAGDIDMDGNRIEDLPDPTAAQDPDTRAARIAAILAHIAVAGAHHARYTDGEAVTAAKTVKLDDFATPDDNTDLNASAARHGLFKKLDGVANHFLNGLGNWVIGGGATLTVPPGTGTQVYNANSPTNWTDLDLSATIGAKASVVMIKIYWDYATANSKMAFRKNGDTDSIERDSHVSGISDFRRKYVVIVVPTDSSGIVEWRAYSAHTTILDIIAYIN